MNLRTAIAFAVIGFVAPVGFCQTPIPPAQRQDVRLAIDTSAIPDGNLMFVDLQRLLQADLQDEAGMFTWSVLKPGSSWLVLKIFAQDDALYGELMKGDQATILLQGCGKRQLLEEAQYFPMKKGQYDSKRMRNHAHESLTAIAKCAAKYAMDNIPVATLIKPVSERSPYKEVVVSVPFAVVAGRELIAVPEVSPAPFRLVVTSEAPTPWKGAARSSGKHGDEGVFTQTEWQRLGLWGAADRLLLGPLRSAAVDTSINGGLN